MSAAKPRPAPVGAQVLTPEEAADYLRLRTPAVLTMLRGGEIPARKVSNRWRILREDLERFVRGDPDRRRETLVQPHELEALEKEAARKGGGGVR